jgi:hypothetical protein
VSEQREHETELVTAKSSGGFTDYHGLKTSVGTLQCLEERGGFGPALPWQGPALTDVKELGDDDGTRRQDRLRAESCHRFELVGSCWSSVLTRP